MEKIIRKAKMSDLEQIARVEAECFPPAEAASESSFKDRLEHFSDCFWLCFDGDRLVSVVDGFITDEADLTDEMFARAELHNPDGAWQMIFGVETVPEYRGMGLAGELLRLAIKDTKDAGRRGLVLTCKEKKIGFYEQFGFVNEGISKSVHGGAVWYQMRIEF